MAPRGCPAERHGYCSFQTICGPASPGARVGHHGDGVVLEEDGGALVAVSKVVELRSNTPSAMLSCFGVSWQNVEWVSDATAQ